MGIGAGFLPVAAPPLVPPRVGLIAAAKSLQEGDARWENGYAYAPENSCASGQAVDVCDSTTKEDQANLDIVQVTPIEVVAMDKCSAFGVASQRDFEARARRLLLAVTERRLGNEFWTGTLAQAKGYPNRFLADAAHASTLSTATAPLEALACLEQAIADCGVGGPGMIHATPAVATLWFAARALERQGNLLVTANDNIVVASPGYDGSTPNGAAATDGNVWAYATGLVRVGLGAIEIVPGSLAQALDRSTNTIRYIAERRAAADWDGCCHFGINIDAPVCAFTPAGS